MIKKYWNEYPLQSILWLAFIARLVAAIFAKGYGWHDDHFLVLECSQSWVDDTDYNNWLPKNGNTQPSGHSFFYPGLHFLLFSFLKLIHITDPEWKMFIVRFIHAIYSLITVYCGYRIAEKLSSKEIAKKVGLMLAVLWFLPFLSVRNLVEFVCIPFLAAGIWLLIKHAEDKNTWKLFLAGIILGCALNLRYQSVFFLIGIGLALLIQKQWKATVLVTFGACLAFISFQGLNDYFIWGKPFVEFEEYVRYNIENAHGYLQNDWYVYLELILGLLIPPISLFWAFGFARTWKKALLIFIPVVLFTAFHSYFPNKQERFILPVIPFIIIAGVMGWEEFVKQSAFWQHRKKLLTGFMIWFWCLNLILLPVFCTFYSKRARVESMLYLSNKQQLNSFIVECTHSDAIQMFPRFYLKQWIPQYNVTPELPYAYLADTISMLKNKGKEAPDYVIFIEDVKLTSRVDSMKTLFPDLKFETEVIPSFIDNIFYRLNPRHNTNQTVYIYATK